MKKKLFLLLPFITVISLSFISGFSLLKPGLPPTHDGEYHVIRFYEFDKVLREGNLYPRWAPDLNNGFGVPLFNYVYPFPNYMASFLHIFSFSFIDSFKLQMFIAGIVGAIFFYLFSKQFWGILGGMVASVFYTYSPYRLVDIYVRGSVGEVWALALFPAFLWSITKLLKEKRKIFLPISSIFLSLIIFSHNILGLMFFIFSIFYGIFLIFQSKEKKELLIKSGLAIIFGLSLSAVFWLSALLEKGFVTGLKIYDVKDNFPEIYQFILPSWGTGFSSSDLQNQMSFQIGIANLLGILLSIIVLIISIKKKDKKSLLIIFFLVWFILVFFLMTKISLPVWQTIPFLNYFQFPWRFLSLEIFITSFLAGSIFLRKSKLLAFFMIFLAFILTYNYTKPAYYHQRNDYYYISRSNFIDGTNSVGNYFNTIWFDKSLKKQNTKLEARPGVKILSEKIGLQKYQFILSSKKGEPVIVNTAYFPGWTVFLNRKKEIVSNTVDGRILFNIPEGETKVEVELSETLIRRFSSLISFITVLILVTIFIRKFKNKT